MTKIIITCKKCEPEKIMENVEQRTLPFSEGQTSVWTCIHVRTFKTHYPEQYLEIK